MWRCLIPRNVKVSESVSSCGRNKARDSSKCHVGGLRSCQLTRKALPIHPIIFHRGQITDTTDSWQTHSAHFWTFLDTNRDDWRLVKPCDVAIVASRCQDQYENFIQARQSFAVQLCLRLGVCVFVIVRPILRLLHVFKMFSVCLQLSGRMDFSSLPLYHCHICAFPRTVSTVSTINFNWFSCFNLAPTELLARILWMHLDPLKYGFQMVLKGDSPSYPKLHFDQQDIPGVASPGGYAAGSCIDANATDAIRQLLGKEARFYRTV